MERALEFQFRKERQKPIQSEERGHSQTYQKMNNTGAASQSNLQRGWLRTFMHCRDGLRFERTALPNCVSKHKPHEEKKKT